MLLLNYLYSSEKLEILFFKIQRLYEGIDTNFNSKFYTNLVKIAVPSVAKNAMVLLEENGYSAYLVGGTVRDLILHQRGIISNLDVAEIDIDIATDALPEQIKDVFQGYKQFDQGIRHGTVGVFFRGRKIDITTFRVEGYYSDGRRPDQVQFVNELNLDLARRDFTINAMAADVQGNVYDPYNGLQDLEGRLVRAVGDPLERFEEDSLRMIRAVRFAAKLNFLIEESTLAAIRNSVHLIRKHKISGERIFVELEKTFHYSALTGLKYFNQTGISNILFPESLEWCKNLPEKLGKTLDKMNFETCLAVIYLKGILQYLKLDEVFSELNIDKLKGFFVKKYPGLGKWRAINIAILVLLLGESFKLEDSIASIGEIRRWYFKPWYYFKSRQKENLMQLLKPTAEIVAEIGKTEGKQFTLFKEEGPKVTEFLSNYHRNLDGDDLKRAGIRGRAIADGLWLIDLYAAVTSGKVTGSEVLAQWKKTGTSIILKDLRKLLAVTKPTFSLDEDSTLVEVLKIEAKIRHQLGTFLNVMIDLDEENNENFVQRLKQEFGNNTKDGIVLSFETEFDQFKTKITN